MEHNRVQVAFLPCQLLKKAVVDYLSYICTSCNAEKQAINLFSIVKTAESSDLTALKKFSKNGLK